MSRNLYYEFFLGRTKHLTHSWVIRFQSPHLAPNLPRRKAVLAVHQCLMKDFHYECFAVGQLILLVVHFSDRVVIFQRFQACC